MKLRPLRFPVAKAVRLPVLLVFLGCAGILHAADSVPSVTPETVARYIPVLREFIHRDYEGMFRAEGGAFRYPFLAPGSVQYSDVLWDWDSWLSDIALRYEQGCVLNYLDYGGMDGWVPILLKRNSGARKELPAVENTYESNMHKPCLAQHAAFLTQVNGGDAEWLREHFHALQAFVTRYENHQRHKPTGLYYWNNDTAIGVDNDPCTFMRPPKSSGSIFLNCMMYKELLAMVCLCEQLNMTERARELAGKTIVLFGRDFERFGALHEYYLPENGEPVLNKGFQN